MPTKALTALAAALMIGAAPAALAQTAPQAAPAPGAPSPQIETAPGDHVQPGVQPGPVPFQDTGVTPMTEPQMREVLAERNVTDITRLEREAGVYHVEGTWFGKETTMRVDALTGAVIEPEFLDEEQVAHALEEEGYTDVADLERDEDHFTATAMRDDAEVRVRIDARTGHVVEEEEA